MTEYYFVDFYFCSRNSVNKEIVPQLSILLWLLSGQEYDGINKQNRTRIIVSKYTLKDKGQPVALHLTFKALLDLAYLRPPFFFLH